MVVRDSSNQYSQDSFLWSTRHIGAIHSKIVEIFPSGFQTGPWCFLECNDKTEVQNQTKQTKLCAIFLYFWDFLPQSSSNDLKPGVGGPKLRLLVQKCLYCTVRLTWYLIPDLKYPRSVLDSLFCISLYCTGPPPKKSSSCVAKMAAAPLSSWEHSSPEGQRPFFSLFTVIFTL